MKKTLLTSLLLLCGCSAVPTVEVVGSELAAVTGGFLASLDAEQRKAAQLPLADEETMAWHFVPGRYAGVELGALNDEQRAQANEVLRTMLSATGFAKAMAIRDLESVLHELESKPNKPATHRDPDRYALLVCGDPVPNGTFVVRYQGHHVSLRMAVVAGMLVGHSPRFFGTNPHVLPEKFARPPVLGTEERLARELLATLGKDQLSEVVINQKAPADVVLGPGKVPAELGARVGLSWADLGPVSRQLLWCLLEVHANMLRPDVANDELARIRAAGCDELFFAWAGSTTKGKGHYYRIHGVDFAVEYDCTQNGANHVHVVWRDFKNDFGGEALRRHLREQHGR